MVAFNQIQPTFVARLLDSPPFSVGAQVQVAIPAPHLPIQAPTPALKCASAIKVPVPDLAQPGCIQKIPTPPMGRLIVSTFPPVYKVRPTGGGQKAGQIYPPPTPGGPVL